MAFAGFSSSSCSFEAWPLNIYIPNNTLYSFILCVDIIKSWIKCYLIVMHCQNDKDHRQGVYQAFYIKLKQKPIWLYLTASTNGKKAKSAVLSLKSHAMPWGEGCTDRNHHIIHKRNMCLKMSALKTSSYFSNCQFENRCEQSSYAGTVFFAAQQAGLKEWSTTHSSTLLLMYTAESDQCASGWYAGNLSLTQLLSMFQL